MLWKLDMASEDFTDVKHSETYYRRQGDARYEIYVQIISSKITTAEVKHS
jgi:hypothetical protein